MWRSHIDAIFSAYEKWCGEPPSRNAIVVYDSMWHSTEAMARVICEAFADCGMIACLYDLKAEHPSDILPQLLNSRYIAVGSPTLNGQMLPTVAGFLCYLRGLSPGNRESLAFGSYGWGGQSIAQIEKELTDCGFKKLSDSIKINYVPTSQQLHTIYQQVKDAVSNSTPQA